jgi:hypothetical protein
MVLGAEQFVGSSDKLQECVVRGGAKLLVDSSGRQVGSKLDATVHPYHIISLWCWELRGSWEAVKSCRIVWVRAGPSSLWMAVWTSGRIQVESNILTVIISLWCWELSSSWGAAASCRNAW